MNWFDVDRDGLSRLIAGRSKSFVLYELTQNAIDEDGVTKVEITLTPVPGKPVATLVVKDDSPTGFRNLRDAWTLFADSYKKADAQKRGRFNLGEKLVLALCNRAEIKTTTGTVCFLPDGNRTTRREKTQSGTEFCAELRVTREEVDQMSQDIFKVIVPPYITVTFNGQELPSRPRVTYFETTLPTVVAGADGVLRPTTRKCQVEIYKVLPGETASIYEMGIPVVETGDLYHVNVLQKVPLNADRDNVPPSYLRTLRVGVVNRTTDIMTAERANSAEVLDATSDPRCEPMAVQGMLDKRFGKERFTWDLSDPEANSRLVAEGKVPVYGNNLSEGQWKHIREHNLSVPAGVLSPSPKPYTAGGRPEKIIPRDQWTEGVERVYDFYRTLVPLLLSRPGMMFQMKVVREPTVSWAANYGPGGPLTINLCRLGHAFFDEFPGNMERAIDLLIHELGHEYCGNHLSEDYYKALTRLGARCAWLFLTDPRPFQQFLPRPIE